MRKKEKIQRFIVGDIVAEADGRQAVVKEAEKNRTWASGFRYLIDFGEGKGNQMSDGSDLKVVKEINVYRVTDDEYSYFFVARSHGGARAAYCDETGMVSFDEAFDLKISIVRPLKKFIKRSDWGYYINPWEDEHWVRAVYAIGGHFYHRGYTCDACDKDGEKVITLEQMVVGKCEHGETFDSEYTYLHLP